MSAPVLSMRSAAFGYGDQAVVSGADLDVHAGEVIAVLGPNGSGKTTLVRGLLGLTDHLGGEVELFGVPLPRFTDRHRLGYVPQRHTLATSVRSTVAEIVATGRLSLQSWWAPWRRSPAEDRRVVADSLAVVGLADRANSDVTTLSGGQQRRVLIARALATGPEVLVMDEPTAGVDLANQRVLVDVLDRLARGGSTMVIVTHELGAIADVVTRVVAVRAGSIAFDGDPTAYVAATDPLGTPHHPDDDADADHLPGPAARGPLDPSGGGRGA